MDDEKRKLFKSFTMIMQIGINMIVPVFICVMIGNWLDRLVKTQICFLIMLLIGIGAAFRNVYILTKSFYMKDMKKEHEKLEYLQNLKDYSKEHPDETKDYTAEKKKKRYPENNGPTRN